MSLRYEKPSIAGTWTVGDMPAMYWSRHAANLRHVPLGVGDAVQALALEHDVREDSVDPILHLVREAFHHGVDDDHRRHAEHHADDRYQRDIAGAADTASRAEICTLIPSLGIKAVSVSAISCQQEASSSFWPKAYGLSRLSLSLAPVAAAETKSRRGSIGCW